MRVAGKSHLHDSVSISVTACRTLLTHGARSRILHTALQQQQQQPGSEQNTDAISSSNGSRDGAVHPPPFSWRINCHKVCDGGLHVCLEYKRKTRKQKLKRKKDAGQQMHSVPHMMHRINTQASSSASRKLHRCLRLGSSHHGLVRGISSTNILCWLINNLLTTVLENCILR